MAGISKQDRHLRGHPCPVCGGKDEDPRGQGKRCEGFTKDGWCNCARPELAGGITANDAGLYSHRLNGPCNCGTQHGPDLRAREEPEAVYSYRDESGAELFQVVRFPGKKIRQRRLDQGSPDSDRNGYVWSLNGVRRVLYRMPELLEADPEMPVYVVEGEKDVDTLVGRGEVATTNPHGAGRGKWKRVADLARVCLKGRDVIIIADADDEGRPHARECADIVRDVARTLRVVECSRGKDVTDHLAAGGTLGELAALRAEEPELTPPHDDFFDDGSVTVSKEPPTSAEPLRGLRYLPAVAVFGADAFLALAAEKIVYVWQDIAIAGIIVALAGGPGCGKTTLLFWILVARMNTGEPVPVLGRLVTPAPLGMYVVLIEGEHGERSAARKLERTCRLAGIDPNLALGRIIMVARKSVRLGSAEWQDVEIMIAAGIVSDVALDTLARVAPSDANDEREQVAVFDIVARAVDRAPSEATKPVVWANMHARKGGGNDLEAVSGSQQRTGQADTVLQMQAKREAGRVESSTVYFTKLREDPEDYPMPVTFTVTPKGFALSGEDGPEAVDGRPLEVRILEQLSLGPQTKNRLAEKTKSHHRDVEDAVSALFDSRRITTTMMTVKGRTFRALKLRDDWVPPPAVASQPPGPAEQDDFSTYIDREGIGHDDM